MIVQTNSFNNQNKTELDSMVQAFINDLPLLSRITVSVSNYWANNEHWCTVTWFKPSMEVLTDGVKKALNLIDDEVNNIIGKFTKDDHIEKNKFIDLDVPAPEKSATDDVMPQHVVAPPVPDVAIVPEIETPTETPYPKVAVCVYHSNIKTKYLDSWINDFRSTVTKMVQEYQPKAQVKIFELNYGTEIFTIFDTAAADGVEYIHLLKEFANHVAAQNYLFDLVEKQGFEIIANTNADDYYHPMRLVHQVTSMRENQIDIISSNFQRVLDGVIHNTAEFDFLKIDVELNNNNNIIAHPCVTMTAKTWRNIRYYDEKEFIDDKNAGRAPHEDLTLWKKAMGLGKKISIYPEILLFHRLHANQVGKGTMQ